MQERKRIRISAGLALFALCASLHGQIQNVNVSGGSFNETFMISGGEAAEYKVGGSAYLVDNWMFGSLELKQDFITKNLNRPQNKAEIRKYEAKIAKIDAMIRKLSDPDYEINGLALLLGGKDEESERLDLRIDNKDFPGIEEISTDLRSRLIFHMKQLRGEYESQITDFFNMEGLFRYNLYAQEFEMIYGADTFAISAPFNVESINISNMHFMYGLYVKRGKRPHLGSSYFQVLNEGTCKLLKRHNVKIKSGSGPATYSWAGGGDAFVHYESLFYQENEGSEVIPVKRRKKIIRELFSDQKEMIDKFMRSEKINIKKDEDLARVFQYYDSLKT